MVLGNDSLKVLINMQDKVEQAFDEFQFFKLLAKI